MVMGHSTRQWLDSSYDSFHAKLAQHAMDAMTLWHNALLQYAASEQLNAIADASITAATARNDASADATVMQLAFVHATAVQTMLTADAAVSAITACTDDDQGSGADVNTVAPMSSAPILTLSVTVNQSLQFSMQQLSHFSS